MAELAKGIQCLKQLFFDSSWLFGLFWRTAGFELVIYLYLPTKGNTDSPHFPFSLVSKNRLESVASNTFYHSVQA